MITTLWRQSGLPERGNCRDPPGSRTAYIRFRCCPVCRLVITVRKLSFIIIHQFQHDSYNLIGAHFYLTLQIHYKYSVELYRDACVMLVKDGQVPRKNYPILLPLSDQTGFASDLYSRESSFRLGRHSTSVTEIFIVFHISLWHMLWWCLKLGQDRL